MRTHPVTARMVAMHPQGAEDYLRQIVASGIHRSGNVFQNADLASGDVIRIQAPELPPHTGELRDGVLTAMIDLSTAGDNGYVGFHTGSWDREDRLPRIVIDGPLPDRNPDELAGRPIEDVVAHPLVQGQIIARDRPIITERGEGPDAREVTFIPLVDVPWVGVPLSFAFRARIALLALRMATSRPTRRVATGTD